MEFDDAWMIAKTQDLKLRHDIFIKFPVQSAAWNSLNDSTLILVLA